MDFVSGFTTAIINGGILPKSTHDIAPSDRFRRIAQETDRGGKRSISYWLKIERDFAYGYAKDFKTGAEIRFNSALSDPSMTLADIRRVRALLKARQIEEDARTEERHQKIAQRSQERWEKAQEAAPDSSPYLTAKRIKPISIKISHASNAILVPIYDMRPQGGLDLVSIQTIFPDGRKRFPFGGKKSGCFCPLGQINPTKPIVLCEGYATGASLRDALPDSFNVLVAFDAGNLLPVAKAIRKVYKAIPIIIAADNDPPPYYTGQKAAARVQKLLPDVIIKTPPETGTDFNDLPPDRIVSLFGVEAAGGGDNPLNGINSQLSTHAPAPPDWQSCLILDQKNRIVAASLQNAILYLLNHHDFKGVFAYDEFKQDTIVLRCPPWEHEGSFRVESVSDVIITKAAACLERYGINCTIDKTAKAIDVVAYENRFHSAREYLGALEWDGVLRLETFPQDFLHVKEESADYLSFVFKKWLTAAVKRVMEPGCKFDHVLILESQKQGLYKSEFLKTLATFNGERYHSDAIGVSNIGQKDAIMRMQGNLIIEMAELSGFSEKDDNTIKNWLSQTLDEVRIPFSRKIVKYKRQFVFAGTTNNYDYLKDPTGNRRYWPITVGGPINIEAINEIKAMLWAEAVYYYNEGLYVGPTPEENALADTERAKRNASDAWEDMVLSVVIKLPAIFKTSDVLNLMQLKTYEKNEKAIRRVSDILRLNGYENTVKWNQQTRRPVRVWGKKSDEA